MTRRPQQGAKALTPSERKRNERFLDAFADIEKHLKVRLKRKRNDRTAVSLLIDQYERSNPYWAEDADELRHLADIRNILGHQRSQERGYPLVVAPKALEAITAIQTPLASPVPVSRDYGHAVTSVTPDQPLAAVLFLAYKKEFSQFPVIDNGRLRAMVTENAITRWLGRRVHNGEVRPDLASVEVLQVVREEEADYRGQIYDFARSDTPVDEVMAMFAMRPMLEVVLLTASGGSGMAPLEGIVTEWDASRFVTAQGAPNGRRIR